MNKYLKVCIVLFLLFACAGKEKATEVVEVIASPAKNNSAQPFLFSGDKTLLSWIENQNDSVYTLKYAEYLDNKWTKAETITSGTDWFVNWADFPAIAENNGSILSHFLQMSAEGTYTYDIRMKMFPVKTSSWKDDFILHNDGTKSEHGFVTMLPYKEDSFFVTWLDGRNTAGGHDHGGEGAMTLRAAEITAQGLKVDELTLDHKTCDCCQTSAAITSNGPIVVYRDRSDDEIRDIYITRKIDSSWSEPRPIFNDNWKIAGCPVNGPSADAINNMLVVAWYTGASEMPSVKLVFSKNSGVSFDHPISIDEALTIGRVDVAMIDTENVLMSWVTSQDSRTVIKAVKVNVSGEKGEEVVVSELNPSRASGFPQLEIVDDKALFAWTTITEDQTRVTTATISLTDF